MTVTLAVPCYNGESFIARTIEALLAQTACADEILLIDDGSTDQSAAIIKSYPVRLVQHEQNRGLSQARNTALANTRTDLLAFVDADAFADPKMLSALLAVFEKDPGVAGVGGRGVEAVQDTLYDRWRGLHAVQGQGNHPKNHCDHLSGLCMAYRVECLQEINGFDTRLRTNGEDMDVGFRLNDTGFRLSYTPEAVVYHQRKDNLESLKRMMWQWYYWAFLVKQKNHRNPWTLAAGTIRRLVLSDTIRDLLIRKNPAIARLDIMIGLIKLRALLAAHQDAPKLGW